MWIHMSNAYYIQENRLHLRKSILTILTFYSRNTTRLYLSLSQKLNFLTIEETDEIRTNLPKKKQIHVKNSGY